MPSLSDILHTDKLPQWSLSDRLINSDAGTALVLQGHMNKAKRLYDHATSMVGGGETFDRALAVDILVQMEVLATSAVNAYNTLCVNDSRSDLAVQLDQVINKLGTTQKACTAELAGALELHSDLTYRPAQTIKAHIEKIGARSPRLQSVHNYGAGIEPPATLRQGER